MCIIVFHYRNNTSAPLNMSEGPQLRLGYTRGCKIFLIWGLRPVARNAGAENYPVSEPENWFSLASPHARIASHVCVRFVNELLSGASQPEGLRMHGRERTGRQQQAWAASLQGSISHFWGSLVSTMLLWGSKAFHSGGSLRSAC